MSPVKLKLKVLSGGVPRASGDEPVSEEQMEVLFGCSPRERG